MALNNLLSGGSGNGGLLGSGGLLGTGLLGEGGLLGTGILAGGTSGNGSGSTPDPVSGVTNTLTETLQNLLGGGGEKEGLLGNLLGSNLIGLELLEDSVLKLDLLGTSIAVLPDDGGIVKISADGLLGDGGLIGDSGLLNLSGLLGDDGLIDLDGVLQSVIDLLSNGGIDITDVVDPDGNVDPTKFDAVQMGTQGRDSFFIDTSKSTYVDGKGELDVVNFGASTDGFTVAVGSNAAMFTNGSEVYFLDNVERAKFFEGTIAFDFDGNAGKAYRLYQAAFDREPDADGLGYWIDELDRGLGDLTWVANNFIISNEFEARYGNPSTVSNEDFLTLVYQNVLGRNPDAQGYAYWMDELDTGFGRASVLASFSESEENRANVAEAIDDGIWFT